MKFIDFSKYLQRLEETTKRLEMIDILTELISNLDAEEADKAFYLASGYIKAPFENEKFNIAEKMMIKIIEQTFSTPEKPTIKEEIEKIYADTGDLGNVVFELKKATKKYDEPSISEIHKNLSEIAQITGLGSQDLKISKTSNLLKRVAPLSAKHITRIILVQ
jgi:hypothetical protein